MIQEVKTRYFKDVERFQGIIYDNIAMKLGTYAGFRNSLETDYKKTIESFPLLHFIVESLQVDCVISVCKMVEGSNRGERTIQTLLEFAKDNLPILSKEYPKLTLATIEKHTNELKAIEPQINRLMKQRDKYFAHSDKKYFLEPGKLVADFPDTQNDLVDVVRVLQSIIGDHSDYTKGSRRVDMSDFAYLNTFKTTELLQQANDEWLKKYRSDKN